MNKRKSLIISVFGLTGAVLAVLLWMLCAALLSDVRQTPIENAAQIYADAIEKVQLSPNLSYTITETKEQVVGNETFHLESQKQVTFTQLQTVDFQASVTEAMKAGSYTVSLSETFADGTGYFTVENTCFTSELSKADYLARHIPAVAATPSLYGKITGHKENGSTVILLEQGSAPESWINTDGTDFISSGATVTISQNGQLEKTVYSATYKEDGATVFLSVTVALKPLENTVISLPEGPFIPIDDPNIPRMLEIACGYLLETQSITSQYQDRIHSQAFGDLRTQTITLNALSTDTWSSQTKIQVTLDNTGKIGAGSTLIKEELYKDGILKTIVDGVEQPNTQPDMESIKTHIQDILVGTIILPQYIQAATIVEDIDSYRIEFTANEVFGALLGDEACATLYQNTQILREHAEDYTANTTCYLTIQKKTGLPVNSGFQYVGIYTMEGLPYRMEFSADQQYNLLNDTAHQTLEAGA
jgi:hypothetical protein